MVDISQYFLKNLLFFKIAYFISKCFTDKFMLAYTHLLNILIWNNNADIDPSQLETGSMARLAKLDYSGTARTRKHELRVFTSLQNSSMNTNFADRAGTGLGSSPKARAQLLIRSTGVSRQQFGFTIFHTPRPGYMNWTQQTVSSILTNNLTQAFLGIVDFRHIILARDGTGPSPWP